MAVLYCSNPGASQFKKCLKPNSVVNMAIFRKVESERLYLDGVIDLALIYLVFGKSELVERCLTACLNCVENIVFDNAVITVRNPMVKKISAFLLINAKLFSAFLLINAKLLLPFLKRINFKKYQFLAYEDCFHKTVQTFFYNAGRIQDCRGKIFYSVGYEDIQTNQFGNSCFICAIWLKLFKFLKVVARLFG